MADAILTLGLAFMFLAGCVVGAVLAYLDQRRLMQQRTVSGTMVDLSGFRWR